MSRPSCLVYDLYLPSLGGGERVMLTLADALKEHFDVTVAAPDIPPRERLTTMGFPDGVRFERMPPWRYPAATRRMDLAVYLANGVPLPSFAKRSLLMLQFPFDKLSRVPVVRRGSYWCIDRYEILTYSRFVREWTERRWSRTATVLHPPVAPPRLTGSPKEPFILGVGRFFAVEHCKRQDVLLDAYERLPLDVRRDWKIVLAGGSSDAPGSREFLDRLRARAQDLDAEVLVDVPREKLQSLYERASIFWHATGFGRDSSHPERTEHFGITAAEAMSYGAVPMVFNDGGQTEVVDRSCGVLWTELDELVAQTQRLIDAPERIRQLQAAARVRAQEFSEQAFRDGVRRIAGEALSVA